MNGELPQNHQASSESRGASARPPSPQGDGGGVNNAGSNGGAAHRDVIVANKQGLHARPAVIFVDAASKFTAHVVVERDDEEARVKANGKSIIEMLTLAAVPGTKLRIMAEGEDAENAVVALADLISSGFGLQED